MKFAQYDIASVLSSFLLFFFCHFAVTNDAAMKRAIKIIYYIHPL